MMVSRLSMLDPYTFMMVPMVFHEGSNCNNDESKCIYDGSKCIQDDLNVQLTFLYSVPPETNLLVDRQFV